MRRSGHFFGNATYGAFTGKHSRSNPCCFFDGIVPPESFTPALPHLNGLA